MFIILILRVIFIYFYRLLLIQCAICHCPKILNSQRDYEYETKQLLEVRGSFMKVSYGATYIAHFECINSADTATVLGDNL